jgi:hypothetical protein
MPATNVAFMGVPVAPSLRQQQQKQRLAAVSPVRLCADAKSDGDDEPVRLSTYTPPPKTSATWDNVWLDGSFERKGEGSVIDWDLRPSMLREKAGDAAAGICDLCKGGGEIKCTICYGHDFMGKDGLVVCNGCKGKHKVQCSTCYGSGKQVDITGKWWQFDLRAMLRRDK